MARIADALFIGFGLRPEWDPKKPLCTSDITVDVVTTRQFEQVPHFKCIAERLRETFIQEIAMLHIWHLQDKLNKVAPGPGYRVDPETCRAITRNIQLTAGQSLPNVAPHAAQRSPVTLTPTRHHSQSESQSPRNALTPSTARSQRVVEPRTSHTSPRTSRISPRTSHTSPRTSHTSPSTHARQPISPSLPMQHRSKSLRYGQYNTAMTRGTANSWVPLVAPATVFVPTSTPPSSSSRTLQHRSPVVTVFESSSDDSSDDSDIAAAAPPAPPAPPAPSLSCSNRPSWITTPPGSPYGNTADEQPPPAYYTNPDLSSFNFTLPVQNFLCTHIVSPSMLCSIDTILDYSADCWYSRFVEVGLSRADAIELRRLIVEGLSNAELDVVLIGQL
ncbi:uncharacterized protein F5147DRAFT_781283 [Suillus discolor]|uniref:Uncharacterized protein n=1 Tax=Suillus discolor TaxID=1912936 RepID=A0A9P7ESX3_9AGAM|nr:uncharacterized protein F5147DRAFT_781283 [Suillus discolor]KAG2087519.1 hypothetical protein F5147DRAFT_781283 [Suillus discolor]